MAENLEKFYSRIEVAESEVQILSKELNDITSFIKSQNGLELEVPEELTAATMENTKLKHRLAILKRAASKLESQNIRPISYDKMLCLGNELDHLFLQAIIQAFPDIPDPAVTVVLSPKFGDYQCNSAMALVKTLKDQGCKMSPYDVGLKIVENISPSPLIEKLEVARPGFINITISKEYGLKCLTSVLLKNEVLPPPLEKKHRVVVDFSSPNIAKQMHVGHLRSTIIGESVCRTLEYLGHNVLRINHIGDWGTQFGMLIAHLQDEFPDYLTKSAPIEDLQAFYKESKKQFDENPEFKKRAYACVVLLQRFDPDITKAWNMICDVSRKENQVVYDRLGVTIIERGESFYQTRMESLVAELQERGFLEEDDGRKLMWGSTSDSSIPFTIVKSDGGYTYDTSDMATIKQRIEEEGGDWLIYITDMGQATHFKILVNCAKKVGILDPKKVRVDHIGFGVVLGEDKKKFKTRSGATIRLIDLLDEGLKRALDKLIEKGRDQILSAEELLAAQEAVAYGCIKYADLSHNHNHEYVFSFDKMLDDKGNTAVYLLYMYTRIRSIARNANLDAAQLRLAAETTPISLDHEREWKLAKVLLRFPDELMRITNDLCLHHLCEYVYDVSTKFSEFYDACYCIEKNSTGEVVRVNTGRILLCEVTALVMGQCFYLLGLQPVQRM